LRVNGIVEGKYYEGGARRAGQEYANLNRPEGSDTWYVAGHPTESDYSVFKLTVLQPDGTTEVEHYYLNSFPSVSGAESFQTFPIGYEATIDVPGQGFVRYTHQDSDCRALDNCGVQYTNYCEQARNVPNEPGLAVPATYAGKPVNEQFNVVNGANQPFHAQIVHVTVTNVELKQ